MTRILSYLLLSAAVMSTPVYAGIENGKQLHNSSCTSCHISMQGGDGSGIYTRENKRIESYPGLIKQVNRCRDSLGVAWPEEDVRDVVEYLNSTFYKFKK